MSNDPISREAKLLIQLGEMGNELHRWKSECLEQARLLAMSADREEKLRDALKYIAGLDTSQGASPQQCGAVAVAMETLQ